ncbi:unnamed protein product [Prorocentrum cordatum]|uniref:Sodium/hydrogen exchanger n=1 Tax=Prorocentrum cordatum TaxID=2364126 RepID=A0ABN9PA52_9DINO|nr:unnamed protein product [Polarella glacialis]
MEAIHIEVLLPAFVVGCVIDTPGARHELQLQRQAAEKRREPKQRRTPAPAEGSWARPPPGQQAGALRREGAGGEGRRKDLTSFEQMAAVCPPGWVEDEAAAMELGGRMANGQVADDAREGSGDVGCPSEARLPEDDRKSSHSGDAGLSRRGHTKDESHPHESDWEQNVQTGISMVFMVLVGLSMPPLLGENAKGSYDMAPSTIAAHVVMVSLLMVLGKMFPAVCYRDEASWRERVALCMGMCPRGEVGASVIVISLELGVEGPAVIISVCALVINLVLSGGFIGSVKLLLKQGAAAASH